MELVNIITKLSKFADVGAEIINFLRIGQISNKLKSNSDVKTEATDKKEDKDSKIRFAGFGRGDEIAFGSIIFKLSMQQQLVMQKFMRWFYKKHNQKAGMFVSHFAHEYALDKNEAVKKMTELASVGVSLGTSNATFEKMFGFCEGRMYTMSSTVEFLKGLGRTIQETSENMSTVLDNKYLIQSENFRKKQERTLKNKLKRI